MKTSSEKKLVLLGRRFAGRKNILIEDWGGRELLDASKEPGNSDAAGEPPSPANSEEVANG
jgi:hypothetical protein